MGPRHASYIYKQFLTSCFWLFYLHCLSRVLICVKSRSNIIVSLSFCKSLIIFVHCSQVLSLLYAHAGGFNKFNNNVYFHVVLLTSTRIPAHYGQWVPSFKSTVLLGNNLTLRSRSEHVPKSVPMAFQWRSERVRNVVHQLPLVITLVVIPSAHFTSHSTNRSFGNS